MIRRRRADPAKFGWAIDVEEMDPATETAVTLGALAPSP
jgi:hypothetical protein